MGRPLKNGGKSFEKMGVVIDNIDYFYDFVKDDDITGDIGDKLEKYNLTVEDLNYTDFRAKLRDHIINEVLKDEEE